MRKVRAVLGSWEEEIENIEGESKGADAVQHDKDDDGVSEWL